MHLPRLALTCGRRPVEHAGREAPCVVIYKGAPMSVCRECAAILLSCRRRQQRSRATRARLAMAKQRRELPRFTERV